MGAWRLLGGGRLPQGTSEHVLVLRRGAGNQRFDHGDDVTVKTSRDDADRLIQKFKERYEIKTQTIGEAADLVKQLQILNRTVRWTSRGLWIEGDPCHVHEVIEAWGLEGASPAPTPRVAAKGETRVEDNESSIDPDFGA